MTQHTSRTFDTELDELARKITEMGRLVLEQIAGSIKALAGRDLEIARGVIANRDTVDTMHRDIQEKGIVAIARRQPVACDLRGIVNASRIAHDLEHIGDPAEKPHEPHFITNRSEWASSGIIFCSVQSGPLPRDRAEHCITVSTPLSEGNTARAHEDPFDAVQCFARPVLDLDSHVGHLYRCQAHQTRGESTDTLIR